MDTLHHLWNTYATTTTLRYTVLPIFFQYVFPWIVYGWFFRRGAHDYSRQARVRARQETWKILPIALRLHERFLGVPWVRLWAWLRLRDRRDVPAWLCERLARIGPSVGTPERAEWLRRLIDEFREVNQRGLVCLTAASGTVDDYRTPQEDERSEARLFRTLARERLAGSYPTLANFLEQLCPEGQPSLLVEVESWLYLHRMRESPDATVAKVLADLGENTRRLRRQLRRVTNGHRALQRETRATLEQTFHLMRERLGELALEVEEVRDELREERQRSSVLVAARRRVRVLPPPQEERIPPAVPEKTDRGWMPLVFLIVTLGMAMAVLAFLGR